MRNRKPRINPTESKLLKVLLEHNYFLNTTQVAEKAGVSWNTAHIYLKKFYNRKWILKRKRGNRDYWCAYKF